MKRFMFIIDGHGIERWYPVDCQPGDSPVLGETFYGLEFYKVRAALNWDRGCYYLEADLSPEQLEAMKTLIFKRKDWLGGKKFIETITSKNFETETGYQNPFDPDWELSFDWIWFAARKLWLKRAGLDFVEPESHVCVSNPLMIKGSSGKVSERIVIDGRERMYTICEFGFLLPESVRNAPNLSVMTIEYEYLKEVA